MASQLRGYARGVNNEVEPGQLRFDGRVAIVTGAGRGLGREYARLLARRGATVVVNNRTPELADRVVAEIAEAGGSAVADGHDISSAAGAAALVDAASDRFGRIDVVVNNAGITSGFEPFVETDEVTLDAMIGVHVKGSWFVTQRAWASMVAQGYGRVLMTISSAGLWGQLQSESYSMCKGALIGLTRSLALDGRPHGIHVNAISPAGFTRMVTGAARSGDEALLEKLRQTMPAELVAPAAAWLVHAECQATGMLFAAFGPMMAQVFLSQTRGFRTRPEAYTLEAIRDHFDAVLESDNAVHEELLITDGAKRIAALLGVPSPISG
jgi:NAD(P)-dependent dehydrogenase (short-subunit alcohol dehydrogenase family)